MSDQVFRHFVDLVCQHRKLSAKVDEGRAALSGMPADGLYVAEGERVFLGQLGALLQVVDEALPKMQVAHDQVPEAGAGAVLAQRAEESPLSDLTREIEEALGDPVWSLLDEVLADVLRKRAKQDAELATFSAALTSADQKLVPLKIELDNAKLLSAAVVRERGDTKRLNRRYEQANSSVRASLAKAYDDMAVLVQEVAQVDALLASVRAKTEEARKIRKQADLFLIQSPLDARNLYHYEALLRTASEPGVFGVSLQSSSTLVKQDREALSAVMEKVTRLIRGGSLRAPPADFLSARQAAERRGAGTTPPGPALAPPPPSLRSGGAGNPLPAGAGNPLPAGTGIMAGEPAVAARELSPFGPPDTGFSPASPIEEDVSLRATGELMYRLLMPEAVQHYLRTAECSVTLTTNDLELPWELMHDGTEHLCLQRPTARMPLSSYLPPDRPMPPSPDKLRFLLVHPSAELAGAAKEIELIKKGLSEWLKDGRSEGGKDREITVSVDELGPENATGYELNRRLMSGEYHVIHFAGHASFDKEDPDKSGLYLKDGELFLAQKARRLLGGRPLVFLNACESGTAPGPAATATPGDFAYLQTPAAGLASAFVYGGALGCVGAVWPVWDDGAAVLAIQLYSELLGGAMIGEAMRRAREHTRSEKPEQVTWAAFVLYGDPTFQLVSR